jgi:ubiquinone/menaquinone biosynthesis C-methylase UbiE
MQQKDRGIVDDASELRALLSNQTVKRSVFEWDTESWSQSVEFWAQSGVEIRGSKVLELGSRHGGLSLLFALSGAEVVCTDIGGPSSQSRELHADYAMTPSISYRDIDAEHIDFPDNSFDVVVFKSMLGAVARNNNLGAARRAALEMHRILRPGGYVLFAENLAASGLHKFLRRRFVQWGSSWNYMTPGALMDVFSCFDSLQMKNWGFLACWGRTPSHRTLLFHFDKWIAGAVPSSLRYIAFGVATKSGQADSRIRSEDRYVDLTGLLNREG